MKNSRTSDREAFIRPFGLPLLMKKPLVAFAQGLYIMLQNSTGGQRVYLMSSRGTRKYNVVELYAGTARSSDRTPAPGTPRA
jgi:hypothetical protein